MKKNNFLNQLSSIILLLILFLTVFFVRLFMLQKSIFPNGLDGFYYALQAKSFAENFVLENPDLECGYYFCGLCSKICGDPILGVKIWSAFSSALLSLTIFFLIWILIPENKNRFNLSLLAFVFSAATLSVSSLGVNYINNQTGLCFLFLYVAFLLWTFGKKSEKKVLKILATVLFFVLSLLSHKVSAIYALAFTVLFFGFKILDKKSARFLWPAIFVVILAMVLVFLTQYKRFSAAFNFPQLPLWSKGFIKSFGEQGFWGALEISIIFVMGWIFFFLLIWRKHFFEALLDFVLFFPFWNLDSDMGYRMSLNGTVCGIPFLVYCFEKLTLESSFGKSKWGKKIFLIVASTIFFVALFFTPKVYNPKRDPNFAYYKSLVQKIHLPDDSLLIAHLGLNHTYTYYQNLRDCMNWLPDYEIEDEKIWRLAFGANEYRMKSFFPDSNLDEKIISLDENYILVQESVWQKYLSLEDADIAQTFENWFNPYQVRPKYIRSPIKNIFQK